MILQVYSIKYNTPMNLWKLATSQEMTYKSLQIYSRHMEISIISWFLSILKFLAATHYTSINISSATPPFMLLRSRSTIKYNNPPATHHILCEAQSICSLKLPVRDNHNFTIFFDFEIPRGNTSFNISNVTLLNAIKITYL